MIQGRILLVAPGLQRERREERGGGARDGGREVANKGSGAHKQRRNIFSESVFFNNIDYLRLHALFGILL